MSKDLLIESRKVVVPGEVIAKGMEFLPGNGTYRSGDEIKACLLGLTDVNGSIIKVIPLSGAYWPRYGDHVIGKIVDIGHSMWDVDILGPSTAHVSTSEASRRYIDVDRTDLSKIYDIDDYVFAKVIKASDAQFIQLTMRDPGCKRLEPGLVISVSSAKVPRLIGKQGSMVNTLKTETGCDVLIGQNGLVWIRGKEPKNEFIASRAIKYVEENSQREGLTEEVKSKIVGWLNEKA